MSATFNVYGRVYSSVEEMRVRADYIANNFTDWEGQERIKFLAELDELRIVIASELT